MAVLSAVGLSEQKAKAFINLHKCAGWLEPLLFAYVIATFLHVTVHFTKLLTFKHAHFTKLLTFKYTNFTKLLTFRRAYFITKLLTFKHAYFLKLLTFKHAHFIKLLTFKHVHFTKLLILKCFMYLQGDIILQSDHIIETLTKLVMIADKESVLKIADSGM